MGATVSSINVDSISDSIDSFYGEVDTEYVDADAHTVTENDDNTWTVE